MKSQWMLIVSLLFAIVVAVFAVINVEPVTVDYLFGTAEWPLVLIILGSAFMGSLIAGMFGLVRIFRLMRQVKGLQKENKQLKESESHVVVDSEPEEISKTDDTDEEKPSDLDNGDFDHKEDKQSESDPHK